MHPYLSVEKQSVLWVLVAREAVKHSAASAPCFNVVVPYVWVDGRVKKLDLGLFPTRAICNTLSHLTG